MQNRKFFPSDFFNSSPKYGKSKSNNQLIRSEARKGVCSLNRPPACDKNKILGLNPIKFETRKSSIKCRSLSKSK